MCNSFISMSNSNANPRENPFINPFHMIKVRENSPLLALVKYSIHWLKWVDNNRVYMCINIEMNVYNKIVKKNVFIYLIVRLFATIFTQKFETLTW